ncbi:hypothetical protein HDU98_009916 [Podochytrium sp. JEL0797]|nr:hypothetical protein HDU98_009916 [Podochytrium sp. JEL0797]
MDPGVDDPFAVSFKDTFFLETVKSTLGKSTDADLTLKHQQGLGPHNALDYFRQCPQFYDKACNNEQIQMQARFNSLSAIQLEQQMRLHHVQTAFTAVSGEARFQPARPYHWGYEEEYDEDEWQPAGQNHDAMNVDNDEDDGIVIEAGGCDQDGSDSESFMKFQPLAATNYDGARAAYEFSARVDGLIEKMRSTGGIGNGPDWGVGVGTGVAAVTETVASGKGLTLEELKSAAKAKAQARAQEVQAQADLVQAQAGFKRPVDAYRALAPVESSSRKKRRGISTTDSQSGRTPEYATPTHSHSVQSPFTMVKNVASPNAPLRRKQK